jgi:glycosyltransferase involved in cell wall biosynthesis
MDGCDDGTPEIVLKMGKRFSHLFPLIYPKRLGKGGAIMEGFKQVKGNYVLLIDADMPTPPEDLYRLMRRIEDYSLVIGSRYSRDSRVIVKEPIVRILLSRILNLLVRLIFPRLRNIRDTQCGVKILRKDILKILKKDLFITDYLFDVNLIYSTIEKGFKVKEIGLIWKHDKEKSRIKNLWRVSIKMLISLIRLRIYYSKLKSLELRLMRKLFMKIYMKI